MSTHENFVAKQYNTGLGTALDAAVPLLKATISAYVPGHGTFSASTAWVEIWVTRTASKPVNEIRAMVAERVPDIDWKLVSWLELVIILASFETEQV